MKTAIKLVLIDLLIAQIVAPILIMIPCTIYLFVTTGNLDKVTLTQMIMIPAQLAGQIMMGIYLWKAGYISKKKTTWSPVSAPFLICSGLAILISALLFGVFHINPAQILPAFLIGILLAWTYYKTGSLIPCILMHILNNSLAVYLSIKYPEAENMDDLINGTPYLIVLFGSILLFIGIILTMNHLTSQKQQ